MSIKDVDFVLDSLKMLSIDNECLNLYDLETLDIYHSIKINDLIHLNKCKFITVNSHGIIKIAVSNLNDYNIRIYNIEKSKTYEEYIFEIKVH